MTTYYAFSPGTGRLIGAIAGDAMNNPAARSDLTAVIPPSCPAGQVPRWMGSWWQCEVWPPPASLAELRADKWAEVKKRRDAAEYGEFTWGGSRFNADAESRNRIMGAVQLAQLALAAGSPFSITWTLADNSTRDLSAEEMMQVGTALGQRVGAAHARAAALRVLVNAATSAAELEHLDVSTGWPA